MKFIIFSYLISFSTRQQLAELTESQLQLTTLVVESDCAVIDSAGKAKAGMVHSVSG